MNESLFSFSTYIISNSGNSVKSFLRLDALFLVGRDGVEPSQSQTADLQSVGLTTCSVSPCLVGVIGIEPMTFCV